MALFQQNSGSGSGSKNLVEFKCGKMSLSGTTVTADKRKGLLYVYRDDCTHFCWKDRTSGKVEDDLMVFPNDAEMVSVPQCTTGRVVLLKFKEGNKKIFFWMQEPDSKKDKDEDLIKKVNEALNNPNSSAFEGTRRRTDDPEDALMQILQSGGSTPNQIAQLQSLLSQTSRNQSRSSRDNKKESSGSSGSSQPAKKEKKEEPAKQPDAKVTSSSKPSTPSGAVQLEDLQSILRNMGGATPTPAMLNPVDLSEAMKADDIIPMLANEQIREKLISHLPSDSTIPKTEAELKETLHSAQFKQACNAFSHALSTGQLGPALQQFGVSAAAVEAANKGDVRAFAEAMEKDEGEKRTGDEEMQTD